MVPYSYNMVDMGGIDLAEANGTVVEGLYAKIVEAVNACGDAVLYNWKFAGIEITPQYTAILLGDPIIINGAVQVTEQDEVTVPGINPDPPPPPVIIPLSVSENGEYSADDFNAEGFDPVNVLIPPPTITSLEVTQNGVYTPPSGVAGYSPITVNVVGSSNVEYWNLSNSLIGTLRGIVSTAANVTIQSAGAVFALNGAIRFSVGWDGMTVEIETGDLQLAGADAHRRFIMIGGANTGSGFIYRSTGKWAFFDGRRWEDSTETDGNFFDNCLVKVFIDSTGQWHIYKDGVLFWETTSVLSANYNSLVIGSTSGGIAGTIKNVRVY